MEDTNFPRQQRIVARRLMEAQSGAEMKRLHIVYFLSRKEFSEQPHLIQVHHPSNNSVRLRDFKRWLGELRGKDIPESFTWSFKRKYKTGNIWQDLLDDDLVTPISDNELVLKGSEISPTDRYSSGTSFYTPTKLSSEIIEESSPSFGSETCTMNDMLEQDTIIQLGHSSNKNRKAKKIEETSIRTTMGVGVASSDKPRFAVSFRKLINCRGVDTKDSAVMTARDKKNRPFSNMCSGYWSTNVRSTNMWRMEMRGGSDDQTILGKARQTRNQCKSCDVAKESTKKKGECREDCKPLNRPKCGQCGKAFKPEKLHSHMKSCKGMKILAKASNHAIFPPAPAAENKSKISTASRNSGLSSSVSGYFRISQ